MNPIFSSTAHFMNLRMTDIYRQINEKVININPDYQRDEVWSENKQSALISSIFQNVYIPPLLFSLNNGIYSVMDGKQRISSVKNFINNQFAVKDDDIKYFYSVIGMPTRSKFTFQILSDEQRFKFDNSLFIVAYYANITIEQQRELFQRVQFGEKLSNGEKLNAINSAVVNYAKNICKNNKLFTLMDNKRNQLVESVIKSIYICLKKSYYKIAQWASIYEFAETVTLSNEQKKFINKIMRKHIELCDNLYEIKCNKPLFIMNTYIIKRILADPLITTVNEDIINLCNYLKYVLKEEFKSFFLNLTQFKVCENIIDDHIESRKLLL
jgi:uncharacterized protein with ParB-like and HNH nuclease domain